MHTIIIRFLDNICQAVDEMSSWMQELFTARQKLIEIEMIKADMEYVRQENEKLKKLQFPKKLKEDNRKNLVCPSCKKVIASGHLSQETLSKFCPECGQRIFYSKSYYMNKV